MADYMRPLILLALLCCGCEYPKVVCVHGRSYIQWQEGWPAEARNQSCVTLKEINDAK